MLGLHWFTQSFKVFKIKQSLLGEKFLIAIPAPPYTVIKLIYNKDLRLSHVKVLKPHHPQILRFLPSENRWEQVLTS